MENPPTSTPLSCLCVVGSDHLDRDREFHFGNIELDDDDDDDDDDRGEATRRRRSH